MTVSVGLEKTTVKFKILLKTCKTVRSNGKEDTLTKSYFNR